MGWLSRLFKRKRKTGSSLKGLYFRVVSKLYSEDGRRQAEMREFRNGEAYLVEREWVEGTTFADGHGGRLVGPFASPEAAERFIIATSWFRGHDT